MMVSVALVTFLPSLRICIRYFLTCVCNGLFGIQFKIPFCSSSILGLFLNILLQNLETGDGEEVCVLADVGGIYETHSLYLWSLESNEVPADL